MRRMVLVSLLVLCAAGVPASAQQTAGNITGRVTDEQNAALPGVSVTAREVATGFVRTETTDGQGLYRLMALPVGTYDIRYELASFAVLERKGVVVNVTQTVTLDVGLKLASMSETVTVTGETPLIETTNSAIGGVVEVGRIESMPLNGRQFANLAVTIPGVALGFHSDPTKSTQFSPQINGGNGRNVNYQIDGGDNNDDTARASETYHPRQNPRPTPRHQGNANPAWIIREARVLRSQSTCAARRRGARFDARRVAPLAQGWP